MSKDLFYQMREDEVSSLLDKVENGDERALRVYANLKRCKDLFDEASKQIEPLALNEASEYAEKQFTEAGISFEKRNGSRRFSFTHIPQVKELKSQLKDIEEKSKQAFIAKEKGMLTADENGEEIPLPKVTYTKDVLIVKK